MTAPRIVATCTRLEHIRDAIAIYCEQRGITRLELDRRVGWADGYAGKVLGRRGVRKFSVQSVMCVLAALDLELVVIRSAAAENDTRDDAHGGNARTAWGRRMNGLRNLSMTPAQRSELARKAARIRWRKVRAPSVAAPQASP
jgi:hypothetical protein